MTESRASLPTQFAVSVVVPAHNRRGVIENSIRSLLQQDFSQPYEVIVVDDGSTDGTADVLKGIDPRVRVIRQPNRGAAVARHQGVVAASAPLVAFQDSDDESRPDRLTQLWNALRKHPEALTAFGLSEDANNELVKLWLPASVSSESSEYVIEDPLPLLIKHGTIIGAMNLMTYRREAVAASRAQSFYRAANDYSLQLGLAVYGSFVCVPRILSERRLLPDGISCIYGPSRQAAYSLCAADAACRMYGGGVRLMEAMQDRAEREWCRIAVWLAWHKEWRLLGRVLGIAMRRTKWRKWPRAVWWQIDQLAEDHSGELPVGIMALIDAVRRLR